jgi:hypothetical protein
VRLRFRGEGVEVVLTLAKFIALSTNARRLWVSLQQELARRACHD